MQQLHALSDAQMFSMVQCSISRRLPRIIPLFLRLAPVQASFCRMSANIPSYGKIGAASKEILSGGKEGVYQYAQKASVSAKTVDGVDYTASLVKADKDQLALSLKTSYAADMLKFTGTFTQGGKVVASVAATDLAPGLSATLTGTIPDVNSAKVGVDYIIPHLTVNGTTSLANNPIVEIAASTGRADMFVGGNFVFNSGSNKVSNWTVGAGMTRKDFQIGVHVLNQGQTLKAVYAHNISPSTAAAAELTRSLKQQDEPTAITLGLQKRLEHGALAKVRVESNGLTSLHYETYLQPKNKIGISGQLDAKDLNKAPKLGGFIDVQH